MVTRDDTLLVFDYDGTLHDSALVYLPAFHRAYKDMVQHGLAEPRQWQREEITRYLGCSAVEMWADFMPNAPEAVVQKYSRMIAQGMLDGIEQGKARWYDGAEEALQILRERGYRMVVLSNCRVRYLELSRQVFRMDRFFSGYYPCEAYHFAPKTEIFRTIQQEHPAREYIVIGDRRHDMELAKAYHLRSIGCSYGFGTPEELRPADVTISAVGALARLLG